MSRELRETLLDVANGLAGAALLLIALSIVAFALTGCGPNDKAQPRGPLPTSWPTAVITPGDVCPTPGEIATDPDGGPMVCGSSRTWVLA